MTMSTISARFDPAPTIPDLPIPCGSDSVPRSASPAESLALAAALCVCLVARLPHRLDQVIGSPSWVVALVVAVAVVSVARTLARAPFTRSRSLHARTGPEGGARRWVAAEAGTLLATLAVGTAASLPIYALLRATPSWWLAAWAISATVTVAWQLAMPLALRARLGPLTPAPAIVNKRMRALAARAGVDLRADVAVATKHGARRANAYLVGLGPTRQIVLEQAVLAWPSPLVDQVVAHELGHWRLGHAGRRLPVALLAQLGAFAAAAAALSLPALLHLAGVTSLGDPASYPLLLVVGSVVVFPARCLLAWHGRAQERAADRFALTLLDRADDFTAMLDRVADEGGAARTLPWWRGVTASHPSIDDRAAVARTAHTAHTTGG